MFHSIRRRLGAVALAIAATAAGLAFNVSPAAAATDLGFHYTASGTMHCVLDSNHLVCNKWGPGATSPTEYGSIDVWFPSHCQYGSIVAGNNSGTPGYIYLVSSGYDIGTGTVSAGHYGCSINHLFGSNPANDDYSTAFLGVADGGSGCLSYTTNYPSGYRHKGAYGSWVNVDLAGGCLGARKAVRFIVY